MLLQWYLKILVTKKEDKLKKKKSYQTFLMTWTVLDQTTVFFVFILVIYFISNIF